MRAILLLIWRNDNEREGKREVCRDDGIMEWKIKGVGKCDWRAVVAGEMRETNSNVDRVEDCGRGGYPAVFLQHGRHRMHTHAASLFHRVLHFFPPFLRPIELHALGRVIFDPPDRAQQTYPRVTIRATPNRVKIYPITHVSKINDYPIRLFFIAVDSSLSNFQWNYTSRTYDMIYAIYIII